MIPSEEIRINMYPMDFEEFLWAMDEEAIIQLIKTQYAKLKPLTRHAPQGYDLIPPIYDSRRHA